jgi:hypothetical protein
VGVPYSSPFGKFAPRSEYTLAMIGDCVVDASVSIKLFLVEDLSEHAKMELDITITLLI